MLQQTQQQDFNKKQTFKFFTVTEEPVPQENQVHYWGKHMATAVNSPLVNQLKNALFKDVVYDVIGWIFMRDKNENYFAILSPIFYGKKRILCGGKSNFTFLLKYAKVSAYRKFSDYS